MKALISKNENGRISEIKQDSDTFEVHESMVWVDIPESENIAPNTHLYDIENKIFIAFPKETDDETRFLCARQVAYGSIGEQLDMMYHEIKEKGTLSNTGAWFNHVTKVKTDVTRDNV